MQTVRLDRIALFALAVALFLASPTVVSGQSSPTNPDIETSVPTAALLAEATEKVALFGDIQEQRASLIDRHRAAVAQADALAVQREAIRLPERPDMSVAPREQAEAEALSEIWTIRETLAEQIRTTLEQRLETLGSVETLALQLAHETELLFRAANAALPLVRELERRARAGEVDREALASLTATLAPDMDPQALSEQAQRWRRNAQSAAFDAEAVRSGLAALAAAIAEDTDGQARAERWLQEALARAALKQSYSEKTAGELTALFLEDVGAFDLDYADLLRRLNAALANRTAVDRAVADLDALVPPDVGETGPDNGAIIAQLAQARTAVAQAEAALAYRQDRLGAVRALADAVRAAQADLQGVGEPLAAALEQSIALAVLAEIVTERAEEAGIAVPEGIDLAQSVARRERLREGRADLAALEAQLAELSETAQAEQREALTALVAARRSLRDRRDRLATEEDWAAFSEDLRDLEVGDLVSAFETAAAAYSAGQGAIATLSRELQRLQQGVDTAERALETHVDPTLLEVQARDEAFEAWLRTQTIVLPAVEDAPAPVGETQPDGALAEDEVPERPNADTVAATVTLAERWVTDIRELRDGFVVRRRGFYEVHRDLRQEAFEALSSALVALESVEAQAAEISGNARQAWAAAALLRMRLRAGDLAEEAAPAALEAWQDRDLLGAARQLVDDAAALRAALEARRADLRELRVYDGLIQPLSQWQEALNRQIEELSDIIALEEQFDSVENFESMDPIDRRLLEAEIERRIAADLGVYDVLDDFFASAETETLDEILYRYYERLVVLERRFANLGDRQARVTTLIETTQSERETFEALQDALTETLGVAETILAVRTALVQAALSPAEAIDILTAASEATGQEILATDVPQLTLGADAEAARAERRALITTLAEPWTTVVAYQAWLQDVDAVLDPLGTLSQEVEGYQNHLSRLNAAQSDIGRTISELVGYAPDELQQLTTAGVLGGEIGTVQDQRRLRVNSDAARSLLSLVVIPLVAGLVILLLRLIGRRYVRRKSAQSGGDAGAKMRAETINGVSQTTLTLLVVIMAIIYMLQTVNVAVGPFLASLGFLGLAVAFGAQNLMKDLFSGLFLITENQLNVGEWVKVNDRLVAQVETVGLRKTTLRDWPTGMIHYVPNGQIELISNYNRVWNRRMVWIRVPFDTDVDLVRRLLNEAIEELKDHPTFGPVFHAAFLHPGIGDFDYEVGALAFRVNLDAREVRASGTANTYLYIVKRKFDEAGIPLAITHRKVTAEAGLEPTEGGRTALGAPQLIDPPAAGGAA